MAKYINSGEENVTLILDINGVTDIMQVNMTEHDISFDELNKMSDYDALCFFRNIDGKDKLISDALTLYGQGVANDVISKSESSYFHNEVDGLTLPSDLFASMVIAINDGNTEYYDSLSLFWKWCALNDSPVARDAMFKFLSTYDYTITNTGLFLGYRKVVDMYTEVNGVQYNNLFTFVTKADNKIRMKWKESTKNYFVIDGPDGYMVKTKKWVKKHTPGNVLGSVYELMGVVHENTVFTDSHTKSFNIKMLKPIVERRDVCDFNTDVSCGAGLHIGSPQFVMENGHSFGNVGIEVLINPKDVVSVPSMDCHKMRVNKYLPIGIIRYDKHGEIIQPNVNMFSEVYSNESIRDLEQTLSSMSIQDASKFRIVPKDITLSSFETIMSDIDAMNKKMINRHVKID